MQPAFILSHQWHDTPKGMTLELWCASDDGPVCMEITRQEAVFFIAASEAEPAFKLLGKHNYRIGEARLKNYLNEPVLPLYFLSYLYARDAQQLLNNAGVRTWEADIRPVERYLMERFITGSLNIHAHASTQSTQQHGISFFQNPQFNRSNYKPALRLVSIDIETNMEASALYSIAVYSDQASIVFMVGHAPDSHTTIDFTLVYSTNEKSCLIAFFSWLKDYDPDVLIGWNFIQFDLKVLANLCQKNSITLDIGRANKSINWREDKSTNRYYIQIPGRVALDGIELLKAAFYNFPSFKLDRVAQALLGQGKLISGNDGGQQITTLFNTDKTALARYNLQDCKLVWDIFETTHLMDFCIARSQLTGLLMDKMGGSVAAFEFAYLPKLHRQGYVAPNLGELHSDIISPGGYVLDSIPGIYHNILVLDFKSLYPSIIRTFHIDPYAFWVANHNQLPAEDIIPGFNGAFFSKQMHAIYVPDRGKNL
ncbi:MAG: 3'-5' exonuclease [Marinagarivorans sp.]|nr:3'-5' exonuclease [Marinagarivorans sp.]